MPKSRVKPFQGRLLSVRWNHSQRIRSVNAAYLRSGTPRPPNSVGRHTDVQATRHCPPCAFSLPAQRNPRRRLSISRNTQSGTFSKIKACVHFADNTDFTMVSLPALFISSAFQVGIVALTLSTRVLFLARVNHLVY